MCKHKVKNYQIPLVFNLVPRKMKVKWICVSCGKKGTEYKKI